MTYDPTSTTRIDAAVAHLRRLADDGGFPLRDFAVFCDPTEGNVAYTRSFVASVFDEAPGATSPGVVTEDLCARLAGRLYKEAVIRR